ncbi:MAG: integration host factor, actinobacterial type [Candidatus Geothermincolia bacterium]
MALPTLTEEQRKAALAKAAEVRKQRAEIKKRLKDGAMRLNDVLDKSDTDLVGKMTVKSVIESLPGIGRLRASKIMEEVGISDNRRIRGLGPKQADALLERFK